MLNRKFSFHREFEICSRIGFVFQCEVPPFVVIGFETVAHHDIAQHHTVLLMLWSDFTSRVFSGEGRMGWLSEIIEVASHVHLFFRILIAYRHVYSTALAVTRLSGNIRWEQAIFCKVGIIILLVALIISLRPSHEVVDGFLLAVGIIYFHYIAFPPQFICSLAQCSGRFFSENGVVGFVAICLFPHEVVGCEITQVFNQVGDDVLYIDETLVRLPLWYDCICLFVLLVVQKFGRISIYGSCVRFRDFRLGNITIVQFSITIHSTLDKQSCCQQDKHYGNNLSFQNEKY